MSEDKRAPGRPRLYDDPEEFASRTDAYFDTLEETGKAPTLSGLCLFLGFHDKESFSTYETYGEAFSRTVQKARFRIEDDRNQRLLTKFTPGVIFDLKNNHGWKDKTESDVNHGLQDGVADLLKAVDGRTRGIPTGG